MLDLIDLLVPRPLEVSRGAEEFVLPVRLTVGGLDSPAARWLSRELKRLGFEPRISERESCEIRLLLEEPCSGDESYELEVTADGVRLAAGSSRGLFNAAVTLVQWLELHRGMDEDHEGGRPRRLAGIQVRDRPSFAVRGVMLDISRDKVPRLETLLALIDLFARLKINQFQLYMEHTFAYEGHEDVWRGASPLTAADVRQLDDYCAERFIELVPNQQSFGHMHRWLVHPAYRHLAECPDGTDHPFSLEPEPFSLCPLDPRSLALLADLYDQLLPNFRARLSNAPLFNVGCDETLDLGLGRSKTTCDERGKTRVYLDFLRQVHGLAADRGRRIQIWGDIILQHPEFIAELPEDIIALEWGYEADHPFDEDCGHFAASGREFYVCPGTSSWNSFAGRTENAVGNLAQAAVHGHAHGAVGYLITDWGDFGHLQPLTASYPGFVAGAAFAWNVESARQSSELPLASLLDHHVYRDRSAARGSKAGLAGRITTELGNTYRRLDPSPRNGSALFFLVVFAQLERERERTAGVTLDHLDRAMRHLTAATAGLAALDLDRPDADWVARELAWSADIQIFACRLGRARLGRARLGRTRGVGDLSALDEIPSAERQDLARELRTLIERHREIFMARNRTGGWERSSGWLKRVVELL